MPRRRHLARAVALTLASLTALPCPAQSLRLDYEVGASYTRSDNINLIYAAPDNETVLSPELRSTATQSGSRGQPQARGIMRDLPMLPPVEK